MKERPILFSAPMVRAILEGRKTQTRRVVKPAVLAAINFITGRADETPAETADLGLLYDRPEVEDSRGRTRALKYPEWLVYSHEYPDEGSLPIGQGYGAVGDRLWVRETWGLLFDNDPGEQPTFWRADYTPEIERTSYLPSRWRPSIHMPRARSRINLEVTGVRVERLKDINEADAISEGVEAHCGQFTGIFTCGDVASGTTGRECYRRLWESINGAESWDANPWVWVIGFKRCPLSTTYIDVTSSDEDAGDAPATTHNHGNKS